MATRILRFRRARCSAERSLTSPGNSFMPASNLKRLTSNSERLAGKLQRIAYDNPSALIILEELVDSWLAETARK